jgi:hypothetical protein
VQQRQFPKSDFEALAQKHRAPSRRLQGVLALGSAVALGLFMTGCPEPADLANPDSYAKPPGGTGGSGTGGSGSGNACETACIKTLFQTATQCAGCHGKSLKSAMLDLEASGVVDRLKNVPATHGEVMDKTGCPTGDKLIDTAAPANSWLLKKVNGGHGDCGLAMPVGKALSADELTCMQTFVSCVAGGQAGGTAGASGMGGSGTAGGGGSGSGGSAGAATGGSGGTANTAGAATGGSGGGGGGGTGGA